MNGNGNAMLLEYCAKQRSRQWFVLLGNIRHCGLLVSQFSNKPAGLEVDV